MEFKAVLFDLDGTLLDSLEDIADAMNDALRDKGLPIHPVEKFRFFIGDGVRTLTGRVLPEDRRNEDEIDDLLRVYQDNYRRGWANKTRPYDGIPRLLEDLAHKGLMLTVLSNKQDEFTKKMIPHYFPEITFRIVRGVNKDTAPKPDPRGAMAIAAGLDIKPEQFLYLGDTGTDMKTAVGAGMYPVGVSWGFRPREELARHGARLIIDRPAELLAKL